jgi:glycosyltransferase involved in cell wall biosynthesis
VREDNFPGIALIDGKNIVLTPANDSAALGATLAALLDDRDWRRRLGRAEEQLVRETFSMATVLDQHLSVLAHMAESSG